jgi:hypothetical protein
MLSRTKEVLQNLARLFLNRGVADESFPLEGKGATGCDVTVIHHRSFLYLEWWSPNVAPVETAFEVTIRLNCMLL